MTKSDIIKSLKLELHPTEGGYFRRTYESELSFEAANGTRRLLTSIYYMLTDDSPIGYLHRNQSDIVHYYHLGACVEYLIVSPDGMLRVCRLGPNVIEGELPQLLVKGGDWKASRLCSGEFSLISEAVSPGFEYNDNDLATIESISSLSPKLINELTAFIKSN